MEQFCFFHARMFLELTSTEQWE